MSDMRWQHKKVGDFMLKIDNDRAEWFLCPETPDAWFTPPNSKFKYKLPINEYTEVKVVLFKDGQSAMMPIKWTHVELTDPKDEKNEKVDTDELEKLQRPILSPKIV
jgi:hypothetical protein